MFARAGRENRIPRRLDDLEHRIDVMRNRSRRWPDTLHIATDTPQLIDQGLAFGVARMNDENARAAKVFDETADAGLHAIASSVSQRPPIGETERYGSGLIGLFPSQTILNSPSGRTCPIRGVSQIWLLSGSIWIGPSGASRLSPSAASASAIANSFTCA